MRKYSMEHFVRRQMLDECVFENLRQPLLASLLVFSDDRTLDRVHAKAFYIEYNRFVCVMCVYACNYMT